MIEPQYLHTLRNIGIRLGSCQCHWAITGSLGMALQGVDTEINDIDIQTDQHGAYEIEHLLSEYVVTAVFVPEHTKKIFRGPSGPATPARATLQKLYSW